MLASKERRGTIKATESAKFPLRQLGSNVCTTSQGTLGLTLDVVSKYLLNEGRGPWLSHLFSQVLVSLSRGDIVTTPISPMLSLPMITSVCWSSLACPRQAVTLSAFFSKDKKGRCTPKGLLLPSCTLFLSPSFSFSLDPWTSSCIPGQVWSIVLGTLKHVLKSPVLIPLHSHNCTVHPPLFSEG